MIVAVDGAATDLSVAIAETDGSLIADAGWSSAGAAQREAAEASCRHLRGRELDFLNALSGRRARSR